MINLFNISHYKIDTSKYSSLISDEGVEYFESIVADFVGAKYACSVHSATMAIFIGLLEKETQTIEIPSIMPAVVANAILCANHDISYRDDIDWVGNSYVLHHFDDYKIIDSAQQFDKDQFKKQANDRDLMIFSFYPTKPVGSIDGGMIVSNDKAKIDRLRLLSKNGMSVDRNSWERKIVLPGWKLYMNSVQADIATRNFFKLENKIKIIDSIRDIYNLKFGYSNNSRHLYRLRVKNRENFIIKMGKRGIQCGIHYRALHEIECYKSKKSTSMQKSSLESKQTVSIPFHEKLTNEETNFVITQVLKNADFA